MSDVQRSALRRDLANAKRILCPLEQGKLGTADRDHELTILPSVNSRQLDGPFTVNSRWSPASWPGTQLVEAAGQLFHRFRGGLDYAITPADAGGGACYPMVEPLDPGCCPGFRLGNSMSLYRAGLRLALFLPLGVTTCRRFRRRQASPM